MKIENGLTAEATAKLTSILSTLLADIHQLYIKSLAYHWNVEDSRFSMLHELFEDGYSQLAKDMDEVAERIRALGVKAPGSLKAFATLYRLEDTEDVQTADEMIEVLSNDYLKLANWIREDIKTSDQSGDPGTADLLTGILRGYEKHLWLLRSHLKRSFKT